VRDNPLRLIVKTAVAWRYVTLALCVSALILIVGVVRGNHVGFVFFPSPEAENITASITFTPGVSEERRWRRWRGSMRPCAQRTMQTDGEPRRTRTR
jgi:Cu/Ag efflux pump CusA